MSQLKQANLKIEKLIYGGDGLARLPATEANAGKGKTVFVPFVLEGEEVSAKIVGEKSGFARARAEQIVSASPLRIEPGCPYFLRCGGCHYQHTSYEHQLEIKRNILLETLRRTAKLDWQEPVGVHASPPWNYRNRTRMKVSAAQAGEFAMGYYRFASHQLLPVEQCPISSLLINRAVAVIWEIGKRGGVPGAIREVEYFANADDSELMLELYLHPTSAEESQESLQGFAEALKKRLPELIGAAAFVSAEGEHLDSAKPVWSFGQTEMVYRTKSDSYRVRAGSFFQTNRFMTEKLVELATQGRSGELALDLYAGTGLFSLALARSFERVVAVEAAPASFADLRANAPEKVESVRSTTEEYLRKASGSGRPDYVLVDPPRAGLGEKLSRSLAGVISPRIGYVSCDPSTLARDLRVLIEAGYRVESIDMVDLFPQTFHIETIVQLVR
ncbi:MAG: rRNA m(5)U939 methyltransferase [Acidobacteriales bacterium]|nr:rRNA m(5)U939 methyltransferase [Terriglobales bacterium]